MELWGSASRALLGAWAAGITALLVTPDFAAAQAPNLSVTSTDNDQKTGLIESYPPDYFAIFQPETARDMVIQVPGFTLDGGDDQRGFGEASRNFLINGRRPSTKSQGADEILSRIPARTVIRIEVLDGASLDIPGLSGQVVNIVSRAVELSGRWNYAARFEEGTEPQVLDGGIDISGKRGDVDFSLSLNSGQFTFSDDGIETFSDGSDQIIEDRTEDIQFVHLQPNLNLALSWAPESGSMAGHAASLNASFSQLNQNTALRERFSALTASRASGQSMANQGVDTDSLELSGDYALPLTLPLLGPGTFKLIGLWDHSDSAMGTIFTLANNGAAPSRSAFFSDEHSTETIGRAEYLFEAGSDHDVQLSGEFALNILDSTVGFETDQTPLTEERVRVEEDRFDARITDSWQIRPDLSLQTSLGAEYSTLQVVTPLSEARSFFRPKGFAALSYQMSPSWTLRARAERGVGQLDFGDFVDTRSLAEGRVSSGNGDIKPDQFWELSTEIERMSETGLSGTLRPYLRLIQDPIDRVQFSDGSEGTGNLDDALLYGIEANATLLMDRLGVPGLRFEVEGEIAGSEIDDPLTGRSRRINDSLEWSYEVEARYDVPGTPYALTGEIENDQNAPFVRFDEVQQISVRRPFLSLGLLHKNFYGLQIGIEATNLLNNVVERERIRYFGTEQRLGPVGRIERFERRRGRRLSIELSGTF